MAEHLSTEAKKKSSEKGSHQKKNKRNFFLASPHKISIFCRLSSLFFRLTSFFRFSSALNFLLVFHFVPLPSFWVRGMDRIGGSWTLTSVSSLDGFGPLPWGKSRPAPPQNTKKTNSIYGQTLLPSFPLSFTYIASLLSLHISLPSLFRSGKKSRPEEAQKKRNSALEESVTWKKGKIASRGITQENLRASFPSLPSLFCLGKKSRLYGARR